MTTRRCAWALLFAIGCAGGKDPVGTVLVVARSAVAAQLTRVAVSVSPAGVSTDLTVDPSDATLFTGSLTVPVGAQTVTVQAYAGALVVGTGHAGVTVDKGVAVRADITVLDSTGPAPGPDHSPVVTAIVTPLSAQVNDQPVLTAEAWDPDGDAMTFAWTASPTDCGDLLTPAALSTVFVAKKVGACTIAFAATANGKTDTRSAVIQIAAATGSIDVTVSYVPQPVISAIALSQGGTTLASVSRTASDATIHSPSFHQGTAYGVTISFDPWPTGSVALADSCGGTIVQPAFAPGATSAAATWTPTVASGACELTASLTRETLADSFFVVVLAAP